MCPQMSDEVSVLRPEYCLVAAPRHGTRALRSVRRAVAGLCMCVAAMLALCGFGRSAYAEVLVSSMERHGGSCIFVIGGRSRTFASSFMSGNHPGGYTLTSIELLSYTVGSSLGARSYVLRKNDPVTGELVATFPEWTRRPADLSTRSSSNDTILTLTAPAGTRLNAETKYYLVLWDMYDPLNRFSAALHCNGRQTGMPGWSFLDALYRDTDNYVRPQGNLVWKSARDTESPKTVIPFRMRINGERVAVTRNDDDSGQSSTPAQGRPTISGEPHVTMTLTASTSAITDADGLSKVSYSYQWIGVDESTGVAVESDIAGATGSTFLVLPKYEGNKLKVRVSFTDDGGGSETLTSASTSAVRPAPLTAEFRNLSVETHDGSPFSFDLVFSEDIPGLSYRTLRDSAFTVTDGRITGVRRLEPGKNRRWRVTVRPAGTQDVQIALPITTDCRAAGALCSGGRPLSTSMATRVLGPPASRAQSPLPAAPLTAEFRAAPAEHDGRTAFSFELHFSENVPGLSFRTLRDSAFTVTNGRVTGVRRITQGSNRRWAVNVQPTAPETVTVHLPATADCAGAGAICLPDGTKLSGALAATVLGPPAARVADARAEEGTDDTLDFVVTLARAPRSAVTVDYATSDGTATAGSDYTASRGTLTFAPGETTKTVPVPVLDDAIDEGEETMRLTLSIPSGVKLGDGEAVGTISNSDPLQKMWLSRFGRTAAGHVVDAVSDRLSGPLAGAQVTVGGQSLDFANPVKEQMENVLAGVARTAQAERFPSGRELLLGSAFHLASEGGSGAPGYAAWGRVTMGGFDGEEVSGAVTTRIDGDVTTGIVGADAAWERWLAGLAVSMSSAEGTFGQSGGLADGGRGTVESSLTSVQPYARVEVNERLSAWGLLGWGTGEMTITEAAHGEKRETVTRTDIDMRLGAAGVRGALLEADEAGGMDLVVKADAFLVETQWDKVSNEADTSAGSSRLRLTLEGSRTFEVGEGKVFEPGVELGLRHDGGDAETGTGVEIGGRIRYADTGSGLSVEASARMLLAHEASGFEEWGASGSIRLDPGASGRGLSFSFAPTLGAASSATQRLWSMADTRGLGARDEGFEPEAVLNAEVGYGLGVAGDRFTGTPYAGLGLSGSSRDYRLGWRLAPASTTHSFALNLEGTRSESADGGEPPAYGLMLRGALRW